MSIEVNNESGIEAEETEIVALARHVLDELKVHQQAELSVMLVDEATSSLDPDAVARIFAVKGRPLGHPLIVHVGSVGRLDHWASSVPPVATRSLRRSTTARRRSTPWS